MGRSDEVKELSNIISAIPILFNVKISKEYVNRGGMANITKGSRIYIEADVGKNIGKKESDRTEKNI